MRLSVHDAVGIKLCEWSRWSQRPCPDISTVPVALQASAIHAALQPTTLSAFACLHQVRWYVRRGVPPEQAVAEAEARAELERVLENTMLETESCAAACASAFHVPWSRQYQELLRLIVRLQAARRGSVARLTYFKARSASKGFTSTCWPCDPCCLLACHAAAQ